MVSLQLIIDRKGYCFHAIWQIIANVFSVRKPKKMQIVRVCLILFWAVCCSIQVQAQKKQVGKASYYGKKAHGRTTSSGERYHTDSLTCAHRTYPFGTVLKVRDLKTDKEVFVRVTDRGPFSRGRVIDLSYAAAKELDMLSRGIAHVEIVKVEGDINIPYRMDGELDMPQLEVDDPLGNGYCLLSDWAERNHQLQQEKLVAQSDKKTARFKSGIHKHHTDSIPRWRIFDKLSAQSTANDSREFHYIENKQ